MCAALLVFLTVHTAMAGLAGRPLPDYGNREGEWLRLAGTVSMPYGPPDGSMEGACFYLSQIEQFSEDSKTVICYPGKNEKTLPKAGSRVCVEGVLKPFRKASNPGEFDAAAYYGRKGFLFSMQKVTVVKESRSYSRIQEAAAQFRRWADAYFLHILDRKDGATASAMVLGIKREMDEEVKSLYAGAGISHLLSISGLHLSLIGMGIFGILYRILRRCRKIWLYHRKQNGKLRKRSIRREDAALWSAAAVSALFLYVYAKMTGMSVSTSRALVMFCLLAAARSAGRTTDMATSLAIAGTFILLGNPQNIMDAGFQLSFAAVAGVAAAAPVFWNDRGRDRGGEKGFQRKAVRFWGSALENAVTSFGITFFMLPFLLAHYYEWSPWSVLVNLAVIPLMGILLPCLFGLLAAGVLGRVAQFLGNGVAVRLLLTLLSAAETVIGMTVKGILGCYEGICSAALKLPFSTLHTGAPQPAALIVYVAGAAVLLWKGKKLKPVWRLLCAVFLTGIFLIRLPEGMRITMLDVGQGASVCVEAPSGEVYLLDAGSTSKNDTGKYQIVPYLKYRGVRRVDGIFVSHWDADHINGIQAVLEWAEMGNVPVKRMFLPDTQLKDKALETLLLLAKKYGVPVEYVAAGNRMESGEIVWTCFHPPIGKKEEDRNALSMALRMEYRGFSMMFTGDLEQDGEEWMVRRYGSALRSTLLDAGHHGSKNATQESFLDAVKPKAVLISCGKDNSYGHPAGEMLSRVQERKIAWYVTAQEGALTIEVSRDGGRFGIKGFASPCLSRKDAV
ncbi:MAG: DNA internalization-related competence protein ComEC/Rec2 [Eisenbergiella sp.]